MPSFMKHIGKHGDRKVAIMYRTVPGEDHMALVIYPDTLTRVIHDAVMKVIEGDVAQSENSLADVMHRSLLSDGRPMLTTLHKEGKMKKVRTNEITVTPNATSHVRLDELNKIIDGMEAGDDAAEKMAELDAHAGLVDPTEARQNETLVSEAGADVIDDESLAADQLAQSERMASEGAALVAESKRLQKEAYKLNPALKPKRVVKKRAAKAPAKKSV